eukprot:CAMPEP_0171229868 /NCGR_PEP_ID=MMETSP0790-20130122/39102_1 /TAXON_ID=2925 /ORGANISM="Alexandrium catenella, Strain OF101" /LENGTH=254 /DNA_ID=CAMNT_0011696061 /DNA_START=50 /DNA_END=814 /DNA_ORIENTATION=+
MKSAIAVAAALLATCAGAVRSGVNATSCQAQDFGRRALLQAKLAAFGVECEEMCQKMDQYPNCNCPGFSGEVASEGDARMCLEKYCQDPSTPCPNDNFVTCVKENTKLSLLQWDSLLHHFEGSLGFRGSATRKSFGTAAGSCGAKDLQRRAFIQAKLVAFGVPCEEMCKKMGIYPQCSCPGFEGEPASADDARMCMTKYCQDPSTPCPNDNFVTCVKENTQVSALQWQSLLQTFDAYTGLWRTMAAKKLTKKNA